MKESNDTTEKTLPKRKKRKEPFEIFASKSNFGGLSFETDIDNERFKQVQLGTPLKITLLKDPRNYKHHRKFFKLLSIGFEYWQPEFKTVSRSEQWVGDRMESAIVTLLNQFLKTDELKKAIQDMVATVKTETLEKLGKNREAHLDYEGMKTINGFLDYVMKKAECYDLLPLADGGTYKQRWSIAFDNMPQLQFNDVYKRCFGVIWNDVLSDVFATPEELENRISMLMDFE